MKPKRFPPFHSFFCFSSIFVIIFSSLAHSHEISSSFSISEKSMIEAELYDGALSQFVKMENLKIASQKKTASGFYFQEKGSYSEREETITLLTPAPLAQLKQTLRHELFHVIEKKKREVFQNFLTLAGWKISLNSVGLKTIFFVVPGTDKSFIFSDYDLAYPEEKFALLPNHAIFPTTYSKAGPSEHFAESGTYAMSLMDGSIHENNVQPFSQTMLYRFFVKLLL